MSLTAAQRRYLDKLDRFDVADYLGVSDDLATGDAAQGLLADALDAVRRHHDSEHPGGPIAWCAEAPCRAIDWNE